MEGKTVETLTSVRTVMQRVCVCFESSGTCQPERYQHHSTLTVLFYVHPQHVLCIHAAIREHSSSVQAEKYTRQFK